jgi:CTP synthase
VDIYALELLNLHVGTLKMRDWQEMVRTYIKPANGTVRIAVVGKYMSHRDAYKSIWESLTHASIANSVHVEAVPVESENLEKEDLDQRLEGVHGILVPGGFGPRGIEGKIAAIRHAREKGIPFFGICLGMQCAAIEFARHVCGLKDANSTEFNETSPHPVILLMDAQRQVVNYGGTMRLGSYPCELGDGSHAHAAYGQQRIDERHRHRYEFNRDYRDQLAAKGLVATGLSPDNLLVEIIEIPEHPWFVACQFHPEFKSQPLKAHPLFRDFVRAAMTRRDA